MIILAIDTATAALSAAVLEDNTVRAEVFLNTGEHHSRRLLPAIKHVYDLAGTSPSETDLFVCTHGPGSFTGVRISVSTIKGFAMAANKPVVGISTLAALAASAFLPHRIVYTILDAQGGHIYAAAYQVGADMQPQPLVEEKLCDVESFLSSLRGEEDALFIGSGALKYAECIRKVFPQALIAPAELSHIKASTVGLLGLNKFCDDEKSGSMTLIPRYMRLSEAERKFGMPETEG